MNTPSSFDLKNAYTHVTQVTPDDCTSTSFKTNDVLTQYSLPESSSESETSDIILPPVKPKAKLKPMSSSEAKHMKRVKCSEIKRKQAKLKIREQLAVY